MTLDRTVAALLLLTGAVHLLPGYVALAPSRIPTAYGVSLEGAHTGDLTVLLRHRAVLLALVGAALVVAAILPELRTAAIVGGLVSMGTFLLFAHTTAGLSGPTMLVAHIDAVAIALLGAAAVLHWWRPAG